MGIYFCLVERIDNSDVKEQIPFGSKDGRSYTYCPKAKMSHSAKTENDYDQKWLYSIISPILRLKDLQAEEFVDSKYLGYMDTFDPYCRPTDIPKWIDAAIKNITDEDDREAVINTLREFEKNPKLYYYISY